MKKILLTIFFLLQVSAVKAVAVAPIPCGENAADIVLMLDRTGSISASTRTKEAEAANAFIDAITGSGTSHKISVGRFNDDASDDDSDISDLTDAAIYYSMADGSYSYSTLKTKVTAAMSSQGGGTNLEDAIEVASNELTTNGTNAVKVIVLLSDGESNRRDSLTEDNGESDDHLDFDSDSDDNEADFLGAATDAAEEARAKGIRIITIAYDNTVAGEKKYREVLATMTGNSLADDKTSDSHDVTELERQAENIDGDDFYIALGSNDDADLAAVFLSIAGSISCNDGNACTQDSCNSDNFCTFVDGPSGFDEDQDGVDNCSDVCANAPDVDTDDDGILDCRDECDNNSTDTDGDGTADCNETCDNDPTKTSPGYCGCGTADTYGAYQYPVCDYCPDDDSKLNPGECGCGNPDIYVDESEEVICEVDECPESDKSAPGICGCDVADVDSDEDGALDCNEECDDDSAKADAGVCGCGVADVDADEDEIVDCVDECPGDALNDANDNGICDGDEGGNPNTSIPPAPAVVPAPALNQVQGSGSSCSLNADAVSTHDVSFVLMAMAMMGMVVVRKRMN